MCEIRNVKSKGLFPIIEEVLDRGSRVRITVTGMSMYPFLRHNKDSVTLEKVSYDKVKRGDILLVRMENGQYILHRVIRKHKKKFYLNGDAQKAKEGPLRPEQIIARVVIVWRDNYCISCSEIKWRLLSFLWRLCMPFRFIMIKAYGRHHKKIKLLLFGGYEYE